MKNNTKFLIIVLAILLLSSAVLAGCMQAITDNSDDAKKYVSSGAPYNADANDKNDDMHKYDVIDPGSPSEQSELREKFGRYLHVSKNTLTVFDEAQYAELKAVRDSDKRIPLTYDEILYIVSDSINLYFNYDKIILTNANIDCMLPYLSEQSGNSLVINAEYRDASAYATYYEAKNAYDRMLLDIYKIIFYRIYMHDAGFEQVIHSMHSGQDYIFGNRYNAYYGEMNSALRVCNCQMLAIDGAEFSGENNEEKLVNEYKKLLDSNRALSDPVIDGEFCPALDSPILYTVSLFGAFSVNNEVECNFYIADPQNQEQQIYPTAELKSMMPGYATVYRNESEISVESISFSLDYMTMQFEMNKNTNFSLVGDFIEDDDCLKLYPTNAGDDFDYVYVFKRDDGEWVYNLSKSTTHPSFDIADGIVFYKCKTVVSNGKAVNSFSYAKELQKYPDGTPGVKYSGFKNTDEYEIRTADEAVYRAVNECTVDWNYLTVGYDADVRVWNIMFAKKNYFGGCQNIYIDANGKTLLIVYGE